jgi:clan AA aspartic protease (TIGR02281 family)
MKNITNLDFKRQRVGLTKELSTFAIVGVYKTATMKTKIEIIGLVEVLKHTEKNYSDALGLIFKLEKIADSSKLISKLSKNHLEAKILSDIERLALAPKPDPKANKKEVPSLIAPTYYKKHKTTIVMASGFIAVLLLFFIIKPSKTYKPDITAVKAKQEIFIKLTSRNGHKFINTKINGVLTTFMLDTGASTTVVSESYLKSHTNTGFLNRRQHFLRNTYYNIANGKRVGAEVWQLPSMIIGPKTIYNVEIAVISGIEDEDFLLGMSTINKLEDPTIDLNNNKILVKQ